MVKGRVRRIKDTPVVFDILYFSGILRNIKDSKTAGQILTMCHKGKLHLGIGDSRDRHDGYGIISQKGLYSGSLSNALILADKIICLHFQHISIAPSGKTDGHCRPLPLQQTFKWGFYLLFRLPHIHDGYEIGFSRLHKARRLPVE